MTTQTRAWAHSTGGERPDRDERPNTNGADRPSPGRTRFTGVLLILLSLIPAVLCYLAFATWLPSHRERLEAYQAAEACPAHATEPVRARKDCLSTAHYTVVKTVVKGGRYSRYHATLETENSWRGVVDFGGAGPLLEHLEPGDRVTATIWRRRIMALDKDGVRQNTSSAPRDELQGDAAAGTLVGLLAAQMFVFGAIRLVRPRSYGPFVWHPYGGRILFTIVCASFGVGLLALWADVPWWSVPPAVPVVCAAVMTLPSMRRRPASRWPEDGLRAA